MVLGIDVSKWQGQIDYEAIEDRIGFVFAKATHGQYATDPLWTRNVAACPDVIPLGGYHWWVPQHDPRGQAENFLRALHVNLKALVLPPVIDFEDVNVGALTSRELLDRLLTTLDTLECEIVNGNELRVAAGDPEARDHRLDAVV